MHLRLEKEKGFQKQKEDIYEKINVFTYDGYFFNYRCFVCR